MGHQALKQLLLKLGTYILGLHKGRQGWPQKKHNVEGKDTRRVQGQLGQLRC